MFTNKKQVQFPLIVGTWSLESFVLKEEDEVAHPWGHEVTGLLIYTLSGYMAVSINRFAPWGDGVKPLKESEDIMSRVLSYAGTYRVDSGVVRHDVKNASDPERIGKELTRTGFLEGQRLTLVSNGPGFEAKLVCMRIE